MASLLFLGQNLRSNTMYDLEKDIKRKEYLLKVSTCDKGLCYNHINIYKKVTTHIKF